jgi:hypothetical protein
MPERAPPKAVAMVHVGRVLLGLGTQGVERSKFKLAAHSTGDKQFLASYEHALASGRKASTQDRSVAFDSTGPIARYAQRYVTLMIAAGRTKEVRAFLDEMAVYWDHNAGYSELAQLAFASGLIDVAKHFIEKLVSSYTHYHRNETMVLLARIYSMEGRRAEAVEFLRNCIDRIETDTGCSSRERAGFLAPLLQELRKLQQ